MTTQPLGPPPILTDDPGPWSVISTTFAWHGGPGRRRALPPMGLMISPAPDVGLPLAGLGRAGGPAGVGDLEVIAGAREPAFTLRFEGEGRLEGVSPYVVRAWEVPALGLIREDRPGDDPTVDLPEAPPAASLDQADLGAAVVAPGGEYLGVHLREPRADVVAIVRRTDRALVRWVRGARAVAWSPDGTLIALGGPWGVILARHVADRG